MKIKLLELIIMGSKFLIQGIILQIFFMCVLFAYDGNGQSIKKVDEVFIDLRLNNASLSDAFKAIESKSNYLFSYDKADLDNSVKLNFYFRNTSVYEILMEISKDANLHFKQTNLDIDVKKIKSNDRTTPAIEIMTQTRNITGKVTSYEDGEGLPGVNVVEKGTTNGAVTDVQGNYSLEVSEGATLVFSSVGYTQEEVEIGNRSTIDLTMTQDIQQLQELVVVGYGTQKKENLTGAVSQIDSKVLESRPVTSVSHALQGTMAGVTVQQTDGKPGANANIQIRGFSSLNSGGALVIIDGIPGNLNSLNPNDIESISVLKDAASAAIYGARGAEGVILVTTKTGKTGGIEVFYEGNVSRLTPTVLPEHSNSFDGAIMANVAAENAGASSFYTDEQIALMQDPTVTAVPRTNGREWDYVDNFDWMDYFLSSTMNQNHNLSISGGGERNKYLISAGWLDQNGYFSQFGPDNFDRYNLRFNLINDLIKDKLVLDTRLSLTSSKFEETFADANYGGKTSNSTGQNYLLSILYGAGQSMPLYNPDGTYARYRMQQNTMQFLKESGFDHRLDNGLHGVMSLNWKATSDLVVNGQVGYNVNWTKQQQFGRAYYKYRPEGPPDAFGYVGQPNRVVLTNAFNRYYNTQLTVNYNKTLGSHSIKVLAGGSVEANSFERFNATRFNILGNEVPALNLGTPDDAQNDYNAGEWGIVSGFGRINYDFAGKYLLEANVRTDASSRFSKKNRWGLFPSVSAGWRIIDENFMQGVGFISNLKLRASYGEVGNQNGLGLYDHLAIYRVGSDIVPFPNGNAQHIFNPRLPSQDRTWETITTTNFGVDFGFFEDKLAVEFDYFVKRNQDMLINIEVPSVIGIGVPTNNNGELKTQGWEATIQWNELIEEIDLKYNIGFNIFDQTNEIVSLNQEFVNVTSGIRNLQGYPVNSIFAYESDGYFMTQEEVDNHAFQHAKTGPGDIKYLDKDDDGIISQPNDLIHVGDLTPRYVFGFNMGVSWKNFDVSTLFQGVGKRNNYLDGNIQQPYNKPWDNSSFAAQLDYWTPDNPDAAFPRPFLRNNWNYEWSTHWLQDASYVRLKNLQIGYNFNSGFLGTQRIRVYFNGENLWETSQYLMFDPEINSTNPLLEYPLNRSYTLGLNVTF